MRISLLIFGLTVQAALFANFAPSPIQILTNEDLRPSMVNSVDFHPTCNRFCVTFTHNDRVVIYQLDDTGSATVFQVLEGEISGLSCPQHALFSKDGRNLVVANWCNQTFTVYREDAEGFYQMTPTYVTPFLLPEDHFHPHGIAFSPDGKFLAAAFGASKQYPRGIALYEVNGLESESVQFTLQSFLQSDDIERGIPKGIAFSPDGSSLLVTFSETNSVAIYTIDASNGSLISAPKQVLEGKSTLLSRPEDIKFTVDGNYFAISNSNKNSIALYAFDKKNNRFVQDSPSHTMVGEEAKLLFPHGLAFSSDGKYFAATQFGPIVIEEDGNWFSYGDKMREFIVLYKLER